MRPMTRPFLPARFVLAAALCVLASSTIASAQLGAATADDKKEYVKPNPPILESSTKDGDGAPFLCILGAVVLTAMAVTASLIPSKRGHQD